MKKLFKLLLVALLLFIVYLVFNAITFESKQLKTDKVSNISVSTSAKENLSKAVQIKTISQEEAENMDYAPFDAFNEFIKTTYPLCDSLLTKKTFNTYSHLFTWKGSNSELKPIVLMAHLDVVPVIDKNRSEWKQDPFAGSIVDRVIWGRGTIDDKVSVIGILEAVEQLLKQNYQPERTIYLAFGHDEEIGGLQGAKVIADHLEAQNIKAEFVMDEGGVITQGLVPGIEKDVAIIGLSEKGFVTVELSVEIEGGHSSMPGKETAIDVIANAVSKLKNNPLDAKISEPLQGFIDFVGPEMSYPNKLVFANSGIFESVITSIYSSKASTNAMVRTTTAPTIFNSGVKENVIPLKASATVNFRILPGDTSEIVIAHVKEVLNDERIQLSYSEFFSEPSKVSLTDAVGFRTIQKTIGQVYGDIIVAPTLVVGGTDSKHFKNVSDNVYRFLPIHINNDNIKSFHGINERISVENFENAIRFYVQLIENSSK